MRSSLRRGQRTYREGTVACCSRRRRSSLAIESDDPIIVPTIRQFEYLTFLSDNVDVMPKSSPTVPRTRRDERVTDPALSRPLSEIKAELFKALAHPARIRALEVLAEGERSVGELTELVGIESSHLSQQLAVLRRARLVTSRKDGARVVYAIRDPELVELLAVAKRLLISALAETQDLLAGLRSR
jgi:ArsR family transcriptional regulator